MATRRIVLELSSGPRELILFFPAAHGGNLSIAVLSLKDTCHESTTDRRKGSESGHFGGPPRIDPLHTTRASRLHPVIDLKYLWRSFRSVPQQAGAPRAQAPRQWRVFRSPGVCAVMFALLPTLWVFVPTLRPPRILRQMMRWSGGCGVRQNLVLVR